MESPLYYKFSLVEFITHTIFVTVWALIHSPTASLALLRIEEIYSFYRYSLIISIYKNDELSSHQSHFVFCLFLRWCGFIILGEL